MAWFPASDAVRKAAPDAVGREHARRSTPRVGPVPPANVPSASTPGSTRNLGRVSPLPPLLWLLMVVLLAQEFLLAGDTRPIPQHEVRALYLFNFTKYVDWPAEAFGSTNAPFVIGVMGNQEVCSDLEELARAKHPINRTIVVRRLDKPEEVKGCHLIFLDSKDRPLAPFLVAARDLPLLTVGVDDDFLAAGGIICLTEKDRSMVPDINLAAARRVHLVVSAKLMALGKNSAVPPPDRRK